MGAVNWERRGVPASTHGPLSARSSSAGGGFVTRCEHRDCHNNAMSIRLMASNRRGTERVYRAELDALLMFADDACGP